LDHYTGVGEVLAVHELDRVFGLLASTESDLSAAISFRLDDAKNNNLIFVGSAIREPYAAGDSRKLKNSFFGA